MNQKTKDENSSKQSNGGYYARRPVEEIKAFKSKDGKSFVVQVIKTCVFPINYAAAIIQNESPYKVGTNKDEVQKNEQ